MKRHKLPIICGILVLLAGAVYAGGMFYYQSHFLKGTVIDRIDVSGMTIEDMEKRTGEYLLRIVERQADGSTLEEDVQGKDIALSYTSLEPFEEILRGQNRWLWFLPAQSEHETEGIITYDKEALEQKLDGLRGFREDFATAPADAYISDYTPENGFVIVPETPGNLLNRERTLEAVSAAVEELEEQVNLEAAGCYEEPVVRSDDAQLLQTLETLKKYGDIQIAYLFGDNREVLDGQEISQWLQVDGFSVELDLQQVENYVATLRKRYDSIFRPRTFLTSYGEEITIDEGDYGWWMNYGQEAKELAAMIERGESGERTPVYYQTAAAYGQPDYGNTYVEINLTAQHLFFYKEGELILESDFVSGNSSRGYDTPAGVYGITYKQRNATLVGETYETPVSYWMPFNKNIGMHDATWRSSFGGDLYKTNGSHGCINLPFSVAQELYGEVEKGTPVICYYLPGTEQTSEKELTK
ncbi:MAG: peptidoglycan binding domain-containing protein [Clostridiales bacterium]|nr:peptidoglycan binding domain-containing protein [Clostridiales bacterium]